MYKRTQIRFRKFGHVLSEDDRRWNLFGEPTIVEETGQVSHLSFSPVSPHDLAVTASAKVSIYKADGLEEQRSLTRFKSGARGGTWRSDGALLGAGDDEGVVRVFAPSHGSNAALRIYKGHQGAVHRVAFLAEQSGLASFSDDKTIRVWDLSRSDGKGPRAVLRGHSDYIRAAAASESHPHFLASGSYDHFAMLWDTRTEEMTGRMEHERPVDALLLFPNDGLLVTAGDTSLKIWDVRRPGKRPLATVIRHSKSITSLAFSTNNTRLVSAGLDRLVKVYDLSNYEVVHSRKLSGPVLSLAISPEDRWLALGFADGKRLSIQRREDAKDVPQPQTRPKEQNGREKVVVQEEVLSRLPQYDNLIRQFRHSEALDCLLRNKYLTTRRPDVVVSVLVELSRRGALRKAFSGRDGPGLALLSKFLRANLSRARFLHVCRVLVECYETEFGQLDPVGQAAFGHLSVALEREVEQQQLGALAASALQLIVDAADP